MDFRDRQQSNVPASPQASPVPPAPQVRSTDNSANGKRRIWLPVGLLVSLLILAGLAIAGYKYFVGGSVEGVDSSKYQAVFLANDQVYFGKIEEIDDDTLVLSNIYYLQTRQNTGGTGQDASNPKDESQVTLTKLGNELHGPEDTMRINMDQVLFWENLKTDGKVATAIKEYKP